MASAYLGIGSNLGDRLSHLRFATKRFHTTAGIESIRVSPIYETAPVGPIPQGDFLNAVIELQTTISPSELLDRSREIENESDRRRLVQWGPRTLDIDLLAVDEIKLALPALKLPHPEACRRAFVLVPWNDLAPGFMLHGRTIAQWVTRVNRSGVRKFDGTG